MEIKKAVFLEKQTGLIEKGSQKRSPPFAFRSFLNEKPGPGAIENLPLVPGNLEAIEFPRYGVPPKPVILGVFGMIRHPVVVVNATNGDRLVDRTCYEPSDGGEAFPQVGVLLQAKTGMKATDFFQ